MTTPSIYINLEDNVAKIIARLKREKSSQVILVCPKRCFLFSDSINLRLLKKQVDLLGKEVFILTMDDRGQQYAQEAGFKLRYLPKQQPSHGMNDIQIQSSRPAAPGSVPPEPEPRAAAGVSGFQKLVHTVAEAISPETETARQAPVVPRTPPPQIRTPAVSRAAVPAVSVNDTVFPASESREKGKAKREKSLGKVIIGLVVVSIVLIVVVVFAVLPRADVVVYAKSEPVLRDFKVTIASSTVAVDVDHLQIPAQKVILTLDTQDQFQSQGKKPVGSKADGHVVIYNLTKQPINLKSSTTTFNIGTKSYVLVADLVQVKPSRYKPGTKEIDPASLGQPVEIQATVGGDEYNLPAGTRLEISNKVFGSKPQFLYAKTSEAFVGGNSRYVSVVTDQDINSSQAQLSQELIAQVRQGLAQSSLVMPDGSYAVETVAFSTDKPVGTESPVFTGSLKAKVTGLAFSETDLKNLVNRRLAQDVATDKATEIKTGSLTYKLSSAPDFSNAVGQLLVHFEGKIVFKTSVDTMASQLVGKGKSQIDEIVKARPEIDHVDVTLAPSWQSTFPFFKSRIHVTTAE